MSGLGTGNWSGLTIDLPAFCQHLPESRMAEPNCWGSSPLPRTKVLFSALLRFSSHALASAHKYPAILSAATPRRLFCRPASFHFHTSRFTYNPCSGPILAPRWPHGMASITKTATGWRAQVKLKGIRDSQMFDTKAEAQAWASKRETDINSIESGLGSKTHTVGDVLDEYQKKVSPKKRGARWEILRLELIGRKEIDGRAFKDIRLVDLKPHHITAWRDARERDVSGASVSREMTLLSHALKVARDEWGWLTTDPMKTVSRPPESPPRERRITDSEIDKIVQALGFQEGMPVVLPVQRVAVAFLFAIETAMRSSEIWG